MHLSCLVVSQDRDVYKTVADVFAGIDLMFRQDSSAAFQAISQNHFDAFLIDCDGMAGSPDVISAIRGSPGNRQSTIFCLIDGTTAIGDATEHGANFVLGKPIDATRLTAYLQVSICKREAEHRRYFRYQLSLEAEVMIHDSQPIPAQILNVSEEGLAMRLLDRREGGLAMRLLDRAHLDGPVTIEFCIPGARGRRIAVKAVPSWSAEPIFGMRYLSMDRDSRFAYDKWLATIETWINL